MRSERNFLHSITSAVPTKKVEWTWQTSLFAIYFASFAFLAFFGLFNAEIKPIKGNEELWKWVWFFSFAPWIVLFLLPGTIRNAKAVKPRWKGLGIIIGGAASIGFLYYIAIYSGLPRFLHTFKKAEGVVETTVASKMDSMKKRKGSRDLCRPRVELDIAYEDADVCVSRELFETVKVGDRIKVHGKVSAYAIAPVRVELVK